MLLLSGVFIMIHVNKISCNIVEVLRKSYVTIFWFVEELHFI